MWRRYLDAACATSTVAVHMLTLCATAGKAANFAGWAMLLCAAGVWQMGWHAHEQGRIARGAQPGERE